MKNQNLIMPILIIFTVIISIAISFSHDSTYTEPFPFEHHCIDHVVYYSQHNKLAVAFNADSTVKTCQLESK